MAKGKNLLVALCIGAVLLVGGYFGAHYMAKNVAEQKVKEFFAGMDDVVHAEYGDVDVNLFTQAAEVNDLKVAVLGGKVIDIDQLVLDRYEEKDGVPHAVTVRFSGVDVPVTPEYFGDSVDVIRNLGYEMLHCDYVMDYAYDEKDKIFETKELSLSVKDAGQFSLSFRLGNVDLADLTKGGPSAMLVTVDQAELSYGEDSLMDRLFDMAAKEERMSREKLMAEINQNTDREIQRARANGEDFAAQVMEEIQEFLNNPQTLRVQAQPDEPVAMLQLLGMQDPKDVIRTLGIQVVAD
ncbi:hypothetical protein SAMN02745704_02458 [Paucidesulfovibrio gracilis DSM 16080]|uniref:DUF945 domain-containing protein n=1 Tax=Paucidesulfovibrio gracilis DSM 16080 TaxID=1121449 RepID=A0A1T4XVB1_9BACT|nr:hypothetical protein [Paucidesulfovibrio gracilis]SKA93108.1 hypothetical protein SAMN02745704_02458 [Paucidesulfovibrio gracilis DSM 16080]